MTFRKSLLLLISLSMIAALVACSSSSSSTPPPPAITVTLTAVPATLQVDANQAVTATVTNDSANAGVNWSCTPVGTCGSFSSGSTASGVAVTYTAPLTVPASTVVITATSVTDPTKGQSTPAITITPASGIKVTLTTPPPATLAPSATPNITATVTGDPANGGVNWSCAPGNSASTCGSFSSSSTASGVAVTYTAPTTVPKSAVVITATAVNNSAQSASATVTITSAASGTLTPGNYVFSLSGLDANNTTHTVSGVFTLKSDMTTITGGEQDFFDLVVGPLSDPITGGSVVPSGDGTGSLLITLNTADTCFGPGGNNLCSGTGTEVLVATLISDSKAAVAEYDTWATSSGTLDLQDSTAAAATPTAGYAFVVSAWYGSLAMGGIIKVDNNPNPGSISGVNSIFDANLSGSGNTYQGETFAASAVSPPDLLGRVTFTLNATDSTDFPQIILAGYIVDATHIRLVETDTSFGWGFGGTALGQGANTGNFNLSPISGNSYVVGMTGADGNGVLQAAGLFTAGATTFSGYVDYNDLTGSEPVSPDPITEGTDTYTVDPTGRVSIPGMTDGVITFNQQLYLDGNGNALAITLDNKDTLSGFGYQQTGGGLFNAASFNGTYAADATGWDVNESGEIDAVGPVMSGGAGDFTGFVDLNWIFNTGPTPDLVMSGAFNTTPASGVFTGYIVGLDVTTATNEDKFTFYMVDSTKAVAIETDPNQLTLGYFRLQH
ncbi:conserved exported hypothetical protein [Candidatus Sulfotelmatobacter sp. SbA7]|nr:conserved exported hypothetical protein [Candidatus Sulfotelmatobacter sp. SbA7]